MPGGGASPAGSALMAKPPPPGGGPDSFARMASRPPPPQPREFVDPPPSPCRVACLNALHVWLVIVGAAATACGLLWLAATAIRLVRACALEGA